MHSRICWQNQNHFDLQFSIDGRAQAQYELAFTDILIVLVLEHWKIINLYQELINLYQIRSLFGCNSARLDWKLLHDIST